MIWNGLELPGSPYFQDKWRIIYYNDNRDILPQLAVLFGRNPLIKLVQNQCQFCRKSVVNFVLILLPLFDKIRS